MQSEVRLKQQSPDFVNLIQITDTHIQADPHDEFDGINTRQSLEAVLGYIRENAMPVDAMLVTGDLVHDPAADAYLALAELLQRIDAPVFCIPGNHDEPALMEQYLNTGNISTAKHLQFARWHLCLLDSWLEGTHAGRLDQDELQFLGNALANNTAKHALVVLHHPPVTIDSPWMDAMGLENPDDLFSIVGRNDGVRAIIWGHIHQEYHGHHGDIRLFATPSTCVQFAPKAKHYKKDEKSPGYRTLRLHASGLIDTAIKRVKIAV